MSTTTPSSNIVTLGNMITLSNEITVGGVDTDDSGLTLVIFRPDGGQDSFNVSQLNHDGQGLYHRDYLPDVLGTYRWRWVGDESAQGASEGSFDCVSIVESAVTDVRDLRVLIPACRRAIDGPMATSPNAPATTLSDVEVLGLVADATAELILYTRDTFGLTLNVDGRDTFYMAPNAWSTDQERSTAHDAAILSQAALDHYFYVVKTLKVAEGIKNEAQEWTYNLSANVIGAWIQYLIANRDKAIEALETTQLPPDTYFSLVAERDRMAAAWLEPWVAEIGAPVPYVGGGGSGPLEYDYRFNTWG